MARHELVESRLTYSAIGAFFEMSNRLGFGFLESTYANALEIELLARGHHVAREVSVQIKYKGAIIGIQRLDMIVDHKLVVETKAAHELQKGAMPQIQSYLKAAELELGLLFHFGPTAQFYRFLCRRASNDGSDPAGQVNPNTSCR